MENKQKTRIIALYLPQFHPIDLNNDWWGKGYTEWVNVAKARPLFKGHYQPHLPSDLGFYDLRLSQTREDQAKLAKEAGIEGFCYWHYWLDKSTQLLDLPFKEVLKSGKPDFPFCLGWANHNWKNDQWAQAKSFNVRGMLIEQTYIKEEYDIHFYDVLDAFKDHRYIKVDGKPLFLIYDPLSIPDPEYFIGRWQTLAQENGLKGIHFVGIVSNLLSYNRDFGGKAKFSVTSTLEPATPRYSQILKAGFDAVNSRGQYRAELMESGKWRRYFRTFLRKAFNVNTLNVFQYKNIVKHLFVPEDRWENVYPTLLPNWDRSPRSGKEAIIYHNSTPEYFRKHLQEALDIVASKEPEHRILFLMSWNEWGEGNYIEPDQRFGHGYLDVIKEELSKL